MAVLEQVDLSKEISLGVSWGVSAVTGPRGGRLVRDVEPFSSASEAGIRAGDEILSIDGKPTATPEHVAAILGGFQAGAKVSLEIWRDDSQHVVAMDVLAAPVLDLNIEEADDVLELRIAP